MKLPEFFGLDLGHKNIKFAEIRYNGHSRANIINLATHEVTPGLMDIDSEQAINSLSKELAEAYKKTGLKTKNCVVSIPESSVFSRMVTLPKVSEKEISETIHWAVKPLIPFPIEQVNISFIPISEGRNLEGEFINWYVVAASKKMVEKMQQIIERAGMVLLAVETESLSLARLVGFNFFNNQPEADAMIMDIGNISTNVVLFRNSAVMFSQTISTGSEAVTRVISSDFGIAPDLAEKYKLAFGLDKTLGEGKIANSIEPIIDIMIGELDRTISYYKEKIVGSGLTKIFLTGGGSGLLKLDEYIQNKMNIETVVLNNFPNMSLSPSLSEHVKLFPLRNYSVALGLALKIS